MLGGYGFYGSSRPEVAVVNELHPRLDALSGLSVVGSNVERPLKGALYRHVEIVTSGAQGGEMYL